MQARDFLCAGFRRIGFGRVLSFLAMFFINGSMSYPSQKSWLPDPYFSIIAENIHRCARTTPRLHRAKALKPKVVQP